MRKEIVDLLKQGGVGVLGTDTVYGVVGRALQPETVERIYELRGRDPGKPMVILISSLNDLNLFQIKLKNNEEEILNKLWPGKVSVILPSLAPEFSYLHRGARTLAFRLPKKNQLIDLLKETGPLVAPSANPEGLTPARTVEEAKNYFGDKVDFYLDEGKLDSLPSTLVAIKDGQLVVRRIGAVSIVR